MHIHNSYLKKDTIELLNPFLDWQERNKQFKLGWNAVGKCLKRPHKSALSEFSVKLESSYFTDTVGKNFDYQSIEANQRLFM